MTKTKTFLLPSEKDTRNLAIKLAKIVSTGDIILLEGTLGAGKSTFARFFIRSFLCEETEVPSPTFTLAQTYVTEFFPIWHFDLYRLTSCAELSELGLEEAFSTGVTLVEWPDRLGSYMPLRYLHLSFRQDDSCRSATLHLVGDWEIKKFI